MENIIDVLIVILIFAALILAFYLAFTFKTKSEKEYEKRLEKSLADEYIIDPETGVKLTLEQAESGHWISHDNEFRAIPEFELDNLPTEDEKMVQKAINYLRVSKEYRKTTLTDKQIKVFEKSKTLNSYDDWHYSHPFEFENGIVFLPAPELHGMTYYQDDYCESHVMFWIKIDNINGHYFFREKSSSEKILDLLRNDDELKIADYECFTLKKSNNIILLKNILKNFENEKELEIEIDDENLFIKTTRLVNLNDILRIEKIIKNVC
ncbi:hypothetical protein [Mangrovimonas sp. TPBH4]|uniref:hypothetical protein n=1 Tax=Mangrovimonas sp. TPBH4 TaxID=1645914 RepID=UPI0006B41992|nr:hypothetical protein [Mangrovimonas sp. TPBH4]